MTPLVPKRPTFEPMACSVCGKKVPRLDAETMRELLARHMKKHEAQTPEPEPTPGLKGES